MSADFDDLVARVKYLALDELRVARNASVGVDVATIEMACGTYPQPHVIAEAEAGVLMRLWETIMAAPAGGPYRAPGSGPYYTIELPPPLGGAYVARGRIEVDGSLSVVRDDAIIERFVPANWKTAGATPQAEPKTGDVKPRDPIHDAIRAVSKPGRAHE